MTMTMASPSMMVGAGGGGGSTPTLSNTSTSHHNHNSSFMTPSTSTRSHIVLGASRNSSFSLRIEDPKKSSSIASPAMAVAATTAGASPMLQSAATTTTAAATNTSSVIFLNTTVAGNSNNQNNQNNQSQLNTSNSSSDIADDVSLRIMLEKVPQVRENFSVVEKLGEGTFSKVYKAVRLPPKEDNDDQQQQQSTPPSSSSSSEAAEARPSYALKYITPIVKPARVAKEIRFLRDLQGQSNVVQLVSCFFNAGHTVLVLPIHEHVRFQDVYQRMDVDETREYLRNLLVALDRVHRLGIVHRDIKPANFLYNRDRRQYVLVDFGLSQTQKEIDSTAQYTKHQAMGATAMASAAVMAGGGGSRSAPPVRPSDGSGSSRARSNLSIRFKNHAVMVQHESNSSSQQNKVRRNLTASLTTLSPTKTTTTSQQQQQQQQQLPQTQTQTPVKRSFAELQENQTATGTSLVKDENKIELQKQTVKKTVSVESPVKRQRVAACGLDFIERVMVGEQQSATPSSTAITIEVPETPVKSLRTPLGNRDSNQNGGGGLCTAPSIASHSLNFTTPTKAPLAMEVDHHHHHHHHRLHPARTPVKGNDNDLEYRTCVPDTPPEKINRYLQFASSAKAVLKQKENKSNITTTATTITASSYQHHHQHISNNYSTPKSISFTSMKRGMQPSKRPELSTSADLHHHHQQQQPTTTKACECTAQAYICHGCLSKPELNVPRAGTPGFRAPEILLRSGKQTAKLDIWSAGVIFASILSGRYPFFRTMDDMTCLAEIVTIFGSSRVKRAAAALDKCLIISGGKGGSGGRKLPPIDLKDLCTKLRASLEAAQPAEVLVGFEAPDSAYDLLGHLLDPNPNSRFSAAEALNHPFFKEKGHSLINLIVE